MCLGNYEEAQETLSSIGMDSLVGTETVPTTPVIDAKQNVFSMSDHSRHHLSKERSIPKIAKLSSKAGSSHSQGHPHSHHQRHSLHSSQQQRSSISPKFNSQMNSTSSSQPDNRIRQVSKPAKPVAPKPLSRHENKPRDKERPHQHVSKERPPEKEKHRLPHVHQERDKIQVHQKTSKPVHRPPAVKTEQLSLQEEAQVKHMESGKPFVNEKLRPVHGTQSISMKSPHHNKATTVKAVSSTNSIPIAKPSKMATPKPPPPPSPTVRTTIEQTSVSDSQRSPKLDKDITNAISIPPIDSSVHKKSKEKKLKKKKHKSKPSPSPEPVKDSASKQSATSNSELNTSRPKLSLQIPTKKPVAQKPSSLDLRLVLIYYVHICTYTHTHSH